MIANRRRRSFSTEGLLAAMALSTLLLRCGKFAPDEPRPERAGGAGNGESAGSSAGGNGEDGGEGGAAGHAGRRDGAEPTPGNGSSGGEAGHSGQGESLGGAAGAAIAEPLLLRPERSLLISEPSVLESLTLERVLWRLTSGRGHDLYLAFARSFIPRAEATDGPGPRCDDEAEVEAGLSKLNGFPIPCPAEARGFLVMNENRVWKPLSVTNRFDLAPQGGENCGEQHLSFYLTDIGAAAVSPPITVVAASLRFSAVITNPSPELGLEGCRPLVDFWASLSRSDHDKPAVRAHALEAAFLGPSLSGPTRDPEAQALSDAGFAPFMSAEHFGRRGRLQLLYLGEKGIWHFFEHALVSKEEGWVLRRPLTQSLPVFSLVAEEPSTNPCAAQLIGSVGGLLDDDPANQRLNVAPSCFAGTDVTEGPSLLHGLFGWLPDAGYGPQLSSLLERELNMRYPSYGLYPSTIAARADFAGTCNGCHYLKGSPLASPGSIAHVDPQRSEPCGKAGGDEERSCYARSPLLKFTFLPRWLELLQNFWDRPGAFPALPDGGPSKLAIDGTELVQQNP